jgi:O-antigen ligase
MLSPTISWGSRTVCKMHGREDIRMRAPRRTAYKRKDLFSILFSSPAVTLGAAATALATYQIFTFPIFGSYLPISLFFALACVPCIVTRPEDLSLLCLSGFYWLTLVLSFLWSPDKGTWANGVVYESLFFISFFLARSYKTEAELRKIILIFIAFASMNAIMVIIFRLFPDLKLSYLNSEMVNIFRNPKRVAAFGLFKPNGFSLDKSGGIFDNANTGAAFNMLCLGACASLYGRESKTVLFALSVLFILAIILSGSKSAIILAIVVGLIIATFYVIKSGRSWLFISGFLVGIAILGALPLYDVMTSASDTQFGAETVKTSGYRVSLLMLAGTLFKLHPIMGLGFGGWPLALAPYASFYGLDTSWPPHNSLVNAWAQAGLISALALVTIFGVIFWRLNRSLMKGKSNFRSGGALYSLLCVAGMSLGDPFPLLGSANMAFPLGIVVGWGMISRKPARIKRAPSSRSAELPTEPT